MCQCRGFIAGLACAAAIGAIVVLSGFTSSQQDGAKTSKTPPGGQRLQPGDKMPGPETPGTEGAIPIPPELAAQMEFGSPGPEQRWLAEKEGKWTVAGKFWAGPGEALVSSGTTTFTMILGGRFLREELKSSFMGQPMEGIGTTGFNRATRKFELTWLDSTSTAMTIGTGTRSDDGRTLTSIFEMYDPSTQSTVKMRSVETRIDTDHFSFEMFGPGPDGADMKMMEFQYTRAG